MAAPLFAHSLVLAFAVCMSVALAFVGFWRRRVAGALPFAFLMLAGTLCAFGAIFDIRSRSVEELFRWIGFAYIGLPYIGPLWLLCALSVSGIRTARLTVFLAGLFALSFVSSVMFMTNDLHHMYYRSLSMVRNGPFSIGVIERGPWFWVVQLYSNACLIAADLLLLLRARGAPTAFKRQARIMFLASLFPWAGMIVFNLGWTPYGLDFMPVGLPLGGLLMAWGIFRHRLIDLGVIAYERVFEGMSEGVLVLDRKLRIVDVNPAMARALGASGRDCVGEDAAAFLAPRAELAELVAKGPPASAELRFETEGGIRYYAAKLAPVSGSGEALLGSILSLSDVTDRVELTQRLAELATTDDLTGVANRRTLLEVAQLELARARRQGLALSLLMLDLDEFKLVNDRYGHQVGDAVLAAVARACAACLRSTDRFGRYGGEEFMALLPGIGLSAARAAAERLREAIETLRVESASGPVAITASVGCSGRYRFDGETMDDLVREADEALYCAKAAGRNRVDVYSSDA